MQFYKMLSEYYEEIFPLPEGLVSIVKELTAENGRVLDVGCATGALIKRLIKDGYDAYGLEYSEELIEYKERTLQGDMHKLPYDDGSFDTVVCTGNTLAHVNDAAGAETVLKEFARVLKKGGYAVIQILNYKMILDKRPPELPVIQTDNLKFVRKYQYEENLIRFSGEITAGENRDSSFVMLYPLTDEELSETADKAGLNDKAAYGGFDRSEFISEKSFPLIKIFQK